nr:pancreatic lipase-related protein 2-like isoform X2 [Parasteatoda tepidariorum]
MWLTASFAAALVNIVLSYSYPDNLTSLYPDDANNHMNFTTKCFGDLGCFYTGPPWYHPLYRPITVPPQELHTEFLLHTRSNKKKPYHLKPTPESLSKSPFEENSTLKVFIHGYAENTTVFTSQTGLKAEDIHVIGHSVGGQLVGFVGERVHNLGRITALDPGGPYFDNAPNEVCLDRSDAIFVDVLQTNSGYSAYTGIGEGPVIGHAVFSINGGRHQPGCDYKPAIKLLGKYNKKTIPNQCSHLRVLDNFQSSISTCQYTSYACFSYEGFKAGLCKDTPFTNRMGYHAVKPPYQLNYFLDTTSKAPYCEPK